MYYYDDPSGISTPPTRPSAASQTHPTDGNPATQSPPSILPAWFVDMLTNELLAVLTAAGISPNKTNDGQLAAAITALATGSAAVNNDNLLVNGAFGVNQRGRSSVTDTQYDFDRWYALLQTAAVAPSQLTDPENGAATGSRYTQSQATAQRMGRAQVLESVGCRFLRGKSVTFSGRARMSASTNLRYAICEWTGTADAVTRDLVNDWTSGTYTGGNFFVSSNVNVLAVGSLALTANTWAPFTLTATCGFSMNNLFVFVWSESTQAQNVTLDLDNCKLEPGASATTFRPRATAQELVLCRRYYDMSFPQGTAPAQNQAAGGITTCQFVAGANSNNFASNIRFRQPMRTSPTITLYNPYAANAQAHDASSGADCSSTSAFGVSSEAFLVGYIGAAGGQQGDIIAIQYTADAEL